MNAKIIAGLESINEGLALVISGMKSDYNDIPLAKAETTNTTKTTSAALPVPKSELSTDVEVTEEYLNNLSYNNLKKFAKENNVSAVGSRDEITSRILSGETNPETEAEPEPVKESTAVKKTRGSKKTEPEPEPEEESEESEEEGDDLQSNVEEALREMTEEEIASILADVGVSAKGKRAALISKVVKAVEDGLLSFESDEDEEAEEAEETPKASTKAAKDEAEDSEEDDEDSIELINDPENEHMTDERRTALEAFRADTEEAFDEGKLKRKDLVASICEMTNTNDKMKGVSDEDVLETYIQYAMLRIGDDGETVEEGPYTVNEEPYCCGFPLSYVEADSSYVCEICGNEYAEE